MKHLFVAAVLTCATTAALPAVAVAQSERAVETPAVDPSWFQFDTATQAVSFQLIASLTGLNGALNFNGFRDGEQFVAVAAGGNFQISYPLGNSVFVFGLPKPGM